MYLCRFPQYIYIYMYIWTVYVYVYIYIYLFIFIFDVFYNVWWYFHVFQHWPPATTFLADVSVDDGHVGEVTGSHPKMTLIIFRLVRCDQYSPEMLTFCFVMFWVCSIHNSKIRDFFRRLRWTHKVRGCGWNPQDLVAQTRQDFGTVSTGAGRYWFPMRWWWTEKMGRFCLRGPLKFSRIGRVIHPRQ